MKKLFLGIVLLVVVAIAAVVGFFAGVDKVRNGLIANYPTVKNIVQGATTEVDSTVTIVLRKAEHDNLFELLKAKAQGDSLSFSIPYYARLGIDLSVRNFRVFRDKGTVEVWLPEEKVINCELKFERMTVNGVPANMLFRTDQSPLVQSKLYEFLIPVIEDSKAHSEAARKTVAKALMFYFMPYKFDLKLYVDNQQFELPKVPGVNQTPEEAIEQMLGR